MSRRLILAWAFLALAGPSVYAQIPISRDLLPTRTALGRVGLEQHWMAAVPMEPTEKLVAISLAHGLVFAQTDHGGFHTYDAETGRLLWSRTFEHQIGRAYAASANSKLVFVTNANYLHALDRGTGRTVWSENLGGLPSSPTACGEEYAMVGLQSGMFIGYSLVQYGDQGEIKKDDKGQPVLATRPTRAWNWQTMGAMNSRAIPGGRMVAFASHDGRAYVSLTNPAKPIYRIATGGPIDAPLASYGTRTFFIPSTDENLYSVDLFTAKVQWTYSSGAPILQQPMVVGKDVYVINKAGTLASVGLADGLARWTAPTYGGRLLSISPKRLYLDTVDGDLFVVDRNTGRQIFEPRATYSRAGLNMRAYGLTLTNELNDRLYFGAKEGFLFSTREIGQKEPYLHRDPNAPRFGYIPSDSTKIEAPTGDVPSRSFATPPVPEAEMEENAEPTPDGDSEPADTDADTSETS